MAHRRTHRASYAIAALAVVLGVMQPATAIARSGNKASCRAPDLRGLTLEAARRRSARSDCRLRLEGAPLEDPSIQTVARQSPSRGRRLTVWLNPLCAGSAAYGPEINEPLVTPGPTEVISGFYLEGGPLTRFSAPGCRRPAPPPDAGKVEVLSATGVLVTSQSSAEGHLVAIALAPGTYTLRGTFLSAHIDEMLPTSTQSVVIPPGDTVRQDFFLSVP